jgi:2-keto-4-pentenoate hydratase
LLRLRRIGADAKQIVPQSCLFAGQSGQKIMTRGDSIAQAAAKLVQHRRDRTSLPDLPEVIRPATRADGYRIQAEIERLYGEAVAGWKIAATSTAGQAHIGVDGPLAGRIFASQMLTPDASCPIDGNRMRVAELEFAFRFGRDLPAREQPYKESDVLDAVASLHLAIEIPDSRFEPFEEAGAPQLIADNACSNFLLVGEAVTHPWRDIDMSTHHVRGRIDDGEWRPGSGGNVLGDPRTALAWLVNELSAHGITARAGQAVTTGTCLPPMAIGPGSRIEGDFGVLGRIALSMANA